MTEFSHTSGPWMAIAARPDHQAFIIMAKDGKTVAEILPGHKRSVDEKEANAAILAAAPDMLATLDYILPYLRELDRAEKHRNRDNPTGGHNAEVCINNVLNAIAKATGA